MAEMIGTDFIGPGWAMARGCGCVFSGPGTMDPAMLVSLCGVHLGIYGKSGMTAAEIESAIIDEENRNRQSVTDD